MNKDAVVKNAELVHSLIKEVVDEVGPRLPGTEEEKLGAELFAKQIEREVGITPVIEPFKMAPIASIGFIPVLGYLGYAAAILFYLSPIISLILGLSLFVYAILQIFTYTGVLDFLHKKKPSQNVYATLEPASGQVDRTIMLSGHIDSSWCWNLSLQNPKTMMLKTILGVVSIGMIALVSLIAICNGATSFTFWTTGIVDTANNKIADVGYLIMYLVPVFAIPGCYWLSQYLTWDKKKASPGAMDNLSGCEIALAVVKYYKENPDQLPENTRLIVAGLGCEEAGLKGSIAFCQAHKAEFNEHFYSLNLDSFRDDDYFAAVKGDTWLMSHFDQNLVNLTVETMKECGIENPGVIENPVGGCDSTPLYRAGVKTVTICAQNPVPTNYYHTTNDTVEGLSMYSLEKGFEVVTNLVTKVVELDKNLK